MPRPARPTASTVSHAGSGTTAGRMKVSVPPAASVKTSGLAVAERDATLGVKPCVNASHGPTVVAAAITQLAPSPGRLYANSVMSPGSLKVNVVVWKLVRNVGVT